MEISNEAPVRIILTGPESTGKTLLSMELAREFNGLYISEYAREYISEINRPYTYDDVHSIALHQVEEMEKSRLSGNKIIFYDTYLIITKIWFRIVFKRIPVWIDTEIEKTRDALYLLCKPDIPWIPEPMRENGGEMRNVLFRLYESELNKAGLNYKFVEGLGKKRTECASKQINTFLYNKKLLY